MSLIKLVIACFLVLNYRAFLVILYEHWGCFMMVMEFLARLNNLYLDIDPCFSEIRAMGSFGMRVGTF